MKKQLITLFFVHNRQFTDRTIRTTSRHYPAENITPNNINLTRHSTGTQICTAAIQRGEIAEQQVIHLRWRILPDPLLLQ